MAGRKTFSIKSARFNQNRKPLSKRN